ncbi:hypothetical protein DERF_012889 [Dermatophagoides farinae]|uniref:Uncharacterized protein n=1 Tax=Dermatophagoides farinae TaxID=6954 RepID=A0A922HSS8_DERFA|nr:hypothetical protein DERF_012889 [Dermatophagoides farinae]
MAKRKKKLCQVLDFSISQIGISFGIAPSPTIINVINNNKNQITKKTRYIKMEENSIPLVTLTFFLLWRPDIRHSTRSASFGQ